MLFLECTKQKTHFFVFFMNKYDKYHAIRDARLHIFNRSDPKKSFF